VPIVVDASVSLAWCLQDEQSEYASRVLERLREDTATAPDVWAIEVANGLLVAERRSRLSPAGAAEAYTLLSALPIVLGEQSLDEALGTLLPLARAHRLTIYDAAYLHLAMREGIHLATLDEDLKAAARRVGVEVID
jgi:predicted nucleic acid-binding protein